MESRDNDKNFYYDEQPKTPVIIVGEQDPEENRKNSNASVTSLVLGILSMVFSCMFCLSVVMSVVGMIFGIISIVQQRDGKNMAIAGIITSGIGLVLAVFMGFLWLVVLLFG